MTPSTLSPTRVTTTTREMLTPFTRDELRAYSLQLNVKCGRSKDDTIDNLLRSRRTYVGLTLLGADD